MSNSLIDLIKLQDLSKSSSKTNVSQEEDNAPNPYQQDNNPQKEKQHDLSFIITYYIQQQKSLTLMILVLIFIWAENNNHKTFEKLGKYNKMSF